MSEDLRLVSNNNGVKGPVLLVIMDGIGLDRGQSDGYPGNALDLANAPTIKNLLQNAPIQTKIMAHGKAVGLPDDSDMGNSEVGHNAMGAGRIFDQGAKLVNQAILTGSIYTGKGWMELIGERGNPGIALKENKTVHFIGLLSDGNVHSHINHLMSMLGQCAKSGVKSVRIHTLLDGRDVDEKSAHIYIQQLQNHLDSLDPSGKNYRIASGGGRMVITMDRYEADWEMVERGWKTHVKGEGRLFPDALSAIEKMRDEMPEVIDQDLPPFVIAEDGKPVGPVRDGDIVIFFNFRGDRAIEISRAFTEGNFNKFARDPDVNVRYAGMMEYDGDLSIPPRYLVDRTIISKTISEYLSRTGVTQYAISETQKYGHVTYFWNGNNSEKFDDDIETWVEIPSDRISFDKAPAMKAKEITDELVKAMESGEYRFLRVNYANGDMVGHTGDLKAAIQGVEAVDRGIARLIESAEKSGATIIVTADHGNCENMYSTNKKGEVRTDRNGKPEAKTSHTLNPVPFILVGHDADHFKIDDSVRNPGLANIASSILMLLGYEPPEDYLPSIIVKK